MRNRQKGECGKGNGKGVDVFGSVSARHPHQSEGGNKGNDVVKTVDQPRPCNCLFIGGFVGRSGMPNGLNDTVGDVLPINKECIPLEQVNRSKLP